MYVTVLVWVKIQFDWKQIPFKYKTRKKKNRWKQWQRESAEKIRENAQILLHFTSFTNLHYIYLSRHNFERKTLKRLIMCAKTENYFLYHQCVSNLYKGVLKTLIKS
jgi:hypothetical protein